MASPVPDTPKLILITGAMAAGKSTISQGLAERFSRSAHVRGDTFRRSVVSGRVEMSPDPDDEAWSQLRLRYRLAIQAAEAYVDGGFTTVVQDIIIGSILEEVVSMIRCRPFALIVLAPDPTELARRESGRPKTGYTSFTPHELDEGMRATTPKLGHWLDSTSMTVDETIDEVLRASTLPDGPAIIG